MNILTLIIEASLIVQLVMALLTVMSVYVWVLIFAKVLTVKKVLKGSIDFHKKFSASDNLFTLYQDLQPQSPLEHIFAVGFEEYIEQSKFVNQNPTTQNLSIDLIKRTMQQRFSQEIEILEDRVSSLATIGSSAPYIGLFGTVFGIMNAFQALGQIKHATLSLVAPGITEALIATAMGLFVAIPAVIAYNRFVSHSDRIVNQFESFIDEFIRLIEKQLIISSHTS